MIMDAENVKHILVLGQAWGSPNEIELPDGGLGIAVPDGCKLHTLPPRESVLDRIKQRVTVYDLDSFTAYVDRYRSDATRIFALPGYLSKDGAFVRAIIDYHKPGEPDYGAHSITYTPRYSEAWGKWTKAPAMLQAAFAEWIEENRVDIVDPTSAELLDIVTKFKATKKSDYDSVVYQPNGDVTIAWSERTESSGGKGVQVPQMLNLGIPVYVRGTVYKVAVFLRYRLADGKLTFALKVDRADQIEQDAFDGVLATVREKLAIDVYLGSP
jgi:uncharacterized protein YfdQ (DUF2303 family)